MKLTIVTMSKIIILLFCLSLASLTCAGRWLDEAVRILRQPIPPTRPTDDRILRGIVQPWEDASYRLQVIRVRLGHAWEYALQDRGFQPSDHGFDLIHRRRRIAIELKNSAHASSIVKHHYQEVLRDFKRRNPAYTVVFGFINGGHGSFELQGVKYMYGDALLNYIFQHNYAEPVGRMRAAVRTHFP